MHFDMHPFHTALNFVLLPDRLQSDLALAKCWERFLKMDDAGKNKRIKLICSVHTASWVAQKAMGPPRPALIGTKLDCQYRQSDDLLECTCDVNSSIAAAAILQVVKGASKGIICDLFLLIEGQAEDELPERVLGAARYIKHDLAAYPLLVV
eukprot:Tamp_29964.p1 GENE.Tamp_29964~~Tamp_29964.p1  ORF type:complete len:152 (+),score=31.26 Tamp_29964:243-698(+)